METGLMVSYKIWRGFSFVLKCPMSWKKKKKKTVMCFLTDSSQFVRTVIRTWNRRSANNDSFRWVLSQIYKTVKRKESYFDVMIRYWKDTQSCTFNWYKMTVISIKYLCTSLWKAGYIFTAGAHISFYIYIHSVLKQTCSFLPISWTITTEAIAIRHQIHIMVCQKYKMI